MKEQFYLWFPFSIQSINFLRLDQSFFPRCGFCQINDQAEFSNACKNCQVASYLPDIHCVESSNVWPIRPNYKRIKCQILSVNSDELGYWWENPCMKNSTWVSLLFQRFNLDTITEFTFHFQRDQSEPRMRSYSRPFFQGQFLRGRRPRMLQKC